MGLVDSFDPGAGVIEPWQTVKPVAGFPETLIVTFQPRTFAAFLERHDSVFVARMHLEESVDPDSPLLAEQVRAFEYQGKRLGAYLSPVGAPTTVALMEQAMVMGAKRFVVFGTSGALTAEVGAGGVIVPTMAYRDEGTSYHYAPDSDYMTVASASATAALLSELGVPYHLGPVWTTDGFFRETAANLAKRVADGCLAVDMEVSAVAALAAFRAAPIHHFLYTADSLSDADWEQGTLGSLPAEPRARYFQLAAEIASRLTDAS